MKKHLPLLILFATLCSLQTLAQSGRKRPVEPTPQKDEKTVSQEPGDNGLTDSKISPEGETIEGDVIRVDTSLVMVPVTVVDRYGRYVPLLQRSNFKIFEDGTEQKIAYFATTDQPITVVLLIDTSGSTSFRLEDIQNAAISFASKLKSDDQVMVMSFDDRINVLSRPTSDRALITKAIRRTRTGGGTRLYDAVDSIFTQQLKTISGRKAVVLFTDGVDTTSHRASYDSTLRQAEESDAPIYSVDYDTSGFGGVFTQGLPMPRGRGTILGLPLPTPGGTGIPGSNPGDYKRAVQYLHALANATGGRFYSGDSMIGIGQAFTWIADELSRQYSLGYYPKTNGQSGQRRQIKVKVDQPELIAKSRDSYIYTERKPATNQATDKLPTKAPEKQPFRSKSTPAVGSPYHLAGNVN
ncbi:MAG TPA: VWA domain-containing protein [Pyrinomonadaceae bacterium]|nr:VWA domain-containing protein [Pyrinomonadaceae bacterium]